MSLEDKLERLKAPNLQSQQHTAVVLSSIEDTLTAESTKFTPTAYFAALLALLRQSTSPGAQNSTNVELITSVVYLLDLVCPYVSPALLRSQYSQIFSVLLPLISAPEVSAPLLRSSTGCLESLLVAQDAPAWVFTQGQNGPRQAIVALLALAVDGRPKIRKRSQEALMKILGQPRGPALDHPAADVCAMTALANLKNVVDTLSQAKGQRNRTGDSHDPAIIHALQLTKTIAVASGGWPSKKIEPLCEVLLSISSSSNEFLVMSAFEVFEVIFEGMLDEISSAKLPRLLDAIIELKPSQKDSQLLPPWIAVLSRGLEVSAQSNPDDTFLGLPAQFDLISPFLTSPSHNIRISASECLISFFSNCIPDNVILEPSIYDEKILQQLGDKANGLLAIKYQAAWMEVFKTLAALFDALRWTGNPYLLPIVAAIGELRGSDSFNGKKEADEVLGRAIANLGPETVLSVLPLNLSQSKARQPGRAWLLPLLRDHVSNTNLMHFKKELAPLSEVMYQRVMEHGDAEKTMEIKIFETVVQQIWAILPGYCNIPLDLTNAVDQPFAEMVSNLLYKQTELRTDLCRGLQNLVESNQAVILSDLEEADLRLLSRISKVEAGENLQHLSTFASNLLAVLFNVYNQTLPQHRAYILQCINTYLSITPEADLLDTFNRVSAILESSLPRSDGSPPQKATPSADRLPPASHSLLDLIITIAVHLPRSAFSNLFVLASRILTDPSITTTDAQLVKKAYKLIPRLAISTAGAEAIKDRSSELQSMILSTAEKTPVPARKDRLLAIDTLISFLSAEDLHFIPSVLSEVVLACKDTNEKARQAGFALLIRMANRLSDPELNPLGTVIKNKKIPHMPDDAPDAPATLEEIFTMVSAGLAGVAPHMVAASISALSRLLFEFYVKLEKPVVVDLVSTVEMFLQNNNREIVRSVLGFLKVVVVTLPAEMLEPRMPQLIPGLMVWSKENKGRLKTKVKGILDRCMRKFGAAALEQWVGEAGRKLIVNMRKKRERSKRKNKKADGEESESEDEGGKTFDNEFDEAVYGSEDDSDDAGDSDGDEVIQAPSSRKARKDKEQFIREDDDDEPLDLLGPNALANISSKKTVRFRDPEANKNKTKTKTNEDGKLIFGGPDEDGDDGDVLMSGASGDTEGESAINAYVDAVDGPDALRRGQKGRLKASSGNQRKARIGSSSNEKLELHEEEAREVARNIMRGSSSLKTRGSMRGAKGKPPQRRGLGVEKSRPGREAAKSARGDGTRVGKRGGRPGVTGGNRVRVGGGRGRR